MIHVYAYIKKKGISTYSSYPYQEKKVQCRNGTDSGIKITGYTAVPQTEEALKEAVGKYKDWKFIEIITITCVYQIYYSSC